MGFQAATALLEHDLEALAIFDVNDVEGDKAVFELSKVFPGRNIQFCRVDITDDEKIRNVVANVVASFERIDILLSFAGMVHCEHALNISFDKWRRVLDVNTTGQFAVVQAVTREMVSNGTKGGAIVFVASISAHTVNFPQPQVAHNTSKAAILHMAHGLAAEWATHGIRVNSISPGYMDTRLNEGDALDEARQVWKSRIPLGRMGRRSELNGAVLLLCSEAGSYITGTDIKVDGEPISS